MSDKFRRDGTPYPEGNAGLLEWCADMENMSLRIVKQEDLPNGCWVSTVWLGLDHNFSRIINPNRPPLIFETMGKNAAGEWADYQERYSTEAEALEGHQRAVEYFSSGDFTGHAHGEGADNGSTSR